MNFNPGAHMSAFRGLPFLPAAPVPTHQPFWELPLAPRVTAPISQGNPLVLSAYPGQPYVPGLFTFGQHRPQLRPAGPPHIQNIAHTQGPLNWRAPGPFRGGVEHPAPFLVASSAPRTTVPASASGGIQNYGIHWHLGLRPPAPRPFAQLAPIMFPMNARQWPGTVYGEGALPTFPASVPPDDSSAYENFRRWQRFKTLVRRHLPQTPDVEALSCFLVPVLRSLTRREPNITTKDGLQKGLQEWQRTSNFERMIFYETAQKFMEFEAAEEMEDPRMQLSGVFQCHQPPPVPPRLEIPRPPVPQAVQHPVCTSRKTNLKARAARSLAAKPKAPKTKVPETKARKTKMCKNKVPENKGPKTMAPEEIPPEAIQEYMDIMDELFGPINLATGEPPANVGEEGLEQHPIQDDLYPDPSLLSYVDEDFVKKAENMIHTRFLEEVLSCQPYLNILALTKELEQQEGLTTDQDTRPSEAAANQGAEKHKDRKRHRATEPELLGPKDIATFPSCHGSSKHPPQNLRSSSLYLGDKGVVCSSKATSSVGPHGTANGCSVDDDLQSLDFLLASQHHLLPWGLSQNQAPQVETLDAGDPTLQGPPPKRGCLSPHPPLAAMSKESALTGHACNMGKLPRSGPPLQVTGGQDVDLVTCGSQSQKRKCTSSGTQKKKKRP